MATALELAKQREIRKLKLAGLDEHGNPLNSDDGEGGGDDDDGDDNEDPNRQAQGNDDIQELRAQIENLKRELNAANGRAVPSQQQADEYRRLWRQTEDARQQEATDLRNEIETLRKKLESVNNSIDVNELLTEEERAAIDPGLLNSVVKLAGKIAQHHAPKIDVRTEALRVLEEREATKVQNYRNQVLNDPARGLHQISTLMADPEFITWTRDEDNDIDSVVNSLLAAKSTEEVDRYAKIISKRLVKFKERTKKPADPKTSLSQHMRREAKPKLTEAEVQAKLNEAKQLARSRNPADRLKSQQILNSLE